MVIELDLFKVIKSEDVALKRKMGKKVNKSELWKPSLETLNYKNNTNSWFSIKKLNPDNGTKFSKVIKEMKEKIKKDNNNEDEEESEDEEDKLYISEPLVIKPTKIQRKKLFMWFEICRLVYNMTVDYFKEAYAVLKLDPSNQDYPLNFINVRKIIHKRINEKDHLIKMMNNSHIHTHTYNNAIKDCITAYKAAFTNFKRGNIKGFRLRYRRKCNYSSLGIDQDDFTSLKNKSQLGAKLGNIDYIQPTFIDNNYLEVNKINIDLDKDKLLNKNFIKNGPRLCYNERKNQFIFMIPRVKKYEKWSYNLEICSLDPGMRTFQTVYSQDNLYEICSGDDLKKINKDIDLINKKREGCENNKRGLKKYLSRIRERLKNRINDLHWKSANYLCSRFKTILIGKISKSITSNDNNLPKSTKRLYSAMSHYTYRQRLIHTGKKYDCKVIEVNENHTTKTCGNCAETNNTIGNSKVFICEKCNFICDRDFNAARNILIFNTK